MLLGRCPWGRVHPEPAGTAETPAIHSAIAVPSLKHRWQGDTLFGALHP